MELTAIAPNPMAASCNACLRVKNLFMAFVSGKPYKTISRKGAKNRKKRQEKQKDSFLRPWRFFASLRDNLLFFI
jgi:hypothetical protein